MTYAELQRAFPKHPESFWKRNASDLVAPRLPPEKPEPNRRVPLDRQAPLKKTGGPSVAVIITRCSSGHLDRDNNFSANKPLIDALREAGLISGDTEDDIELFVFQKQVPRKEAGTLIEIIPL